MDADAIELPIWLHREKSAQRRRGAAILSALRWSHRPLPAAIRLALVVAHPDDETVGAGGQIARFSELTIVLVTDGAPKNMKRATQLGFGTRQAYAQARGEELSLALQSLELGDHRVVSLGYTDQEAALRIPEITESLTALFAALRINTIITHAFEGGHPDHDATAFAVHAASGHLRRQSAQPPVLIEMPLYHSSGVADVYQEFRPTAGAKAVHIPLCWPRRRLKRKALEHYVTQKQFLRHFKCAPETFRLAPSYDFLSVPGDGAPYYERHDLGMTQERWRTVAAAAADTLGRELARGLDT